MKSLVFPKLAIGAALACLAWPDVSFAQMPVENTISATGTAVLKKRPQILRLHMELGAKGGDLKDVLARLAARREAARKTLEELGATPSAVEFGDVKIVPGKSDQRRQMEAMIRQRMRVAGKAATQEAAKKELTTVSMSVTAEWPLKSDSAEQRLLFAHELQEKMTAADLGGQKEAEKLSAEEQEISEEDEAQMPRYGYEEGPKFGEPVFLYVAKLTDEEQAKALAEAFGKAKVGAGRLAAAAGTSLGPLRQITNANPFGGPIGMPEEWSDYDFSSNRLLSRLLQRSAAGGSGNSDEAVGMSPGTVSMRIMVQASFAIK
jgi:hypothetical protein